MTEMSAYVLVGFGSAVATVTALIVRLRVRVRREREAVEREVAECAVDRAWMRRSEV